MGRGTASGVARLAGLSAGPKKNGSPKAAVSIAVKGAD
jgi:hypothetical protein